MSHSDDLEKAINWINHWRLLVGAAESKLATLIRYAREGAAVMDMPELKNPVLAVTHYGKEAVWWLTWGKEPDSYSPNKCEGSSPKEAIDKADAANKKMFDSFLEGTNDT